MAGRASSAYCRRAIVLLRVLEVQAGLCKNLDLRDLTRAGIHDLLQVTPQRVTSIVSELLESELLVDRREWIVGSPRKVGILLLTAAGLMEARSVRRQAMAMTVTDRGRPITIARLLGKGLRPKSLALILRHVHSSDFDREEYEAQARVVWESISGRPALALKRDYIPFPESANLAIDKTSRFNENTAAVRRT